MKILKQLLVLWGICVVCEAISALLPFSFPASVIALILVFCLLQCHILKPHHIQDVSNFLLGNLPLLFIPISISVINYWDLVSSQIVAFFLICAISLVFTYAVTLWAVALAVRLTKGGKKS